MKTTIISNGSKWLGEDPDSIEKLIDVLEKNPLDPTFEKYGNFITELDQPGAWEEPEKHKEFTGVVGFFGNFHTISHVFNIRTNDKDIIKRLTTAIRKNQKTDAYESACVEMTCPECGEVTAHQAFHICTKARLEQFTNGVFD